ncbi:hypothetical protein LJB95_01740 [Paludibacteraceae bacterium OttesenSCG-928-F17]|nr:hypothetical protein [Paludibacteraceae bacterium OttesenSCG-928-F17]
MKGVGGNSGIKAIAAVVILYAVMLVVLVLLRTQLFVSTVPFVWSISILSALLLYEIMTVWSVERKINTSRPQSIVNLYMLLKALKVFLFLFTVVIYSLSVKVELKNFVLVTVGICFFYLLFDTLFLLHIEKRKKYSEKLD